MSVPLCRAALHHLTDAHFMGGAGGAGERQTRSGPPDQIGGPGACEGSKDLLVIRQLEAGQAGICCSGTTPRKRGSGPCTASQDLRSRAAGWWREPGLCPSRVLFAHWTQMEGAAQRLRPAELLRVRPSLSPTAARISWTPPSPWRRTGCPPKAASQSRCSCSRGTTTLSSCTARCTCAIPCVSSASR